METEPRCLIRLRSFDRQTWYCISLDNRTCDCLDFRLGQGRPCKHLNALGIFSELRPFVPKTHPTFSQALSALVTYGHLIPGADIVWVDRLDARESHQQNATPAQPEQNVLEDRRQEVIDSTWLPPRDSNPDMLIQSQLSYH